uniref:Uncharacterized protein n=1 Tax=Canis lupus familiaris TaxID=9615 RepID=A0A8C0TRY8_CANLF
MSLSIDTVKANMEDFNLESKTFYTCSLHSNCRRRLVSETETLNGCFSLFCHLHLLRISLSSLKSQLVLQSLSLFSFLSFFLSFFLLSYKVLGLGTYEQHIHPCTPMHGSCPFCKLAKRFDNNNCLI